MENLNRENSSVPLRRLTSVKKYNIAFGNEITSWRRLIMTPYQISMPGGSKLKKALVFDGFSNV